MNNILMGTPGYTFKTFAFKKPSKRFPSGRKCSHSGCATVLSVYNQDDYCFVHIQPDVKYVTRGTKR